MPELPVSHRPDRRRTGLLLAGLLTAALTVSGYASKPGSPAGPAVAAAACTKKLVAAGDMNHRPDTRATGALARSQHPDLVATLGDQQYPDGSLTDYRRRYDQTPWGRLKPITRPVPGHHEYETPGAAGYYAYFGRPKYYGYDIGCGWRGYAMNSLIDIAPQATWLRRDLAAHPGVEVVVSFSDPRYSSGTKHGSERRMQPFWDAVAGRKGLVLNGHEHHYERFAPRGSLREIVAGTGGGASYPFGPPIAGSVKRITGHPGVLVLSLHSGGAYGWRFVTPAGTVLDRGSG
jgi:hypothetical protein